MFGPAAPSNGWEGKKNSDSITAVRFNLRVTKKQKIQASQLPLLVDRPPIFAHLLVVGLDPLLDSGEGGAGAVLEGEESILDESDGSHFDGWGVCSCQFLEK